MEKLFPAYTGNEPYVFVCYAHEDSEIVYPEIVWLREQGTNLWYDEGISAGENWRGAIGDSLLGSSHVLFYISERSLKSDHCNREINLALDEGKAIVPVYLDDIELTTDLKVGLNRVHALHRGQDASYHQHLLNALGQSTSAVEPPPIRHTQDTGQENQPRQKISPGNASKLIYAVAGLLVAIGAAAIYLFTLPIEQSANLTTNVRVPLQLDGWEDWKLGTNPTPSIVFSPDGKTIVYVARNAVGTSSLRVRHLDRIETIELAGTEGARQPFFSPDSRWVGYFDAGLMKRISLSGGTPPSIITNVKIQSWGASWGPDDRIYYAEGRSGLKSILVSGGNPLVATQLGVAEFEESHRIPHHVPDHQVLLLSIFIGGPQIKHEIWALNLSTGKRRYLIDGLAPTYIDSGHIVYAKADIGTDRPREVIQGSLWAVPFDPGSMILTGPELSIQNAVAGREGNAFAVSRSGTLIYLPMQGQTIGELVLLEPSGSRILAQGPLFEHPQISNDGKSIAVTVTEEGEIPSILIYDIESGASRQFSTGARFPLWSPDDQSITYTRAGVGLINQQLDGSEPVETVVPHQSMIVPDAWINQGMTLLYHAIISGRDYSAYSFSLESGNEPREIFTPGSVLMSITTDERWAAVCSMPNGIEVGSFPDMTFVASATDSGCAPHWGNDDKRLYYQDFNKLWAVGVEIKEGIVFGKRELIAELGYPGISLFDIDKNGRIVFARHKDTAPKPPILMMNWMSILE